MHGVYAKSQGQYQGDIFYFDVGLVGGGGTMAAASGLVGGG